MIDLKGGPAERSNLDSRACLERRGSTVSSPDEAEPMRLDGQLFDFWGLAGGIKDT